MSIARIICSSNKSFDSSLISRIKLSFEECGLSIRHITVMYLGNYSFKDARRKQTKMNKTSSRDIALRSLCWEKKQEMRKVAVATVRKPQWLVRSRVTR